MVALCAVAFVPGAAGITIGAGTDLDSDYRATFDGVLPDIRVHGGTVTVDFPRSFHLRDRRRAGEVLLNDQFPWSIEVRGGTADLRGLRVHALDLQGGAERVNVTLPTPQGTVAIRIAGGASNVAFRCPTGVPARLVVIGGATDLTFGSQHLGAAQGQTTLTDPDPDPDYDGGANRYDILVTGGAETLTVDR